MATEYPIHIMVKPEGLDLFPEYISSQIQLLEATYGNLGPNKVIRTVLSRDEVEMIYPGDVAPDLLKEYISKNETEHHFFLGGADIYQRAKEMKGKYGMPTGIRTVANRGAQELGVRMEKWKNFLHTSDNEQETHQICRHFTTDIETCQNCVAKSLCYR